VTTENIIETLQAVLASPPKIKPISTVGRLETMFRACLGLVRSHPLGLFVGVALVGFIAALWTRRRMRRNFGAGLIAPTQSSSGKTASIGKFD
jgi:hypothetical protein